MIKALNQKSIKNIELLVEFFGLFAIVDYFDSTASRKPTSNSLIAINFVTIEPVPKMRLVFFKEIFIRFRQKTALLKTTSKIEN